PSVFPGGPFFIESRLFQSALSIAKLEVAGDVGFFGRDSYKLRDPGWEVELLVWPWRHGSYEIGFLVERQFINRVECSRSELLDGILVSVLLGPVLKFP